MNEHQRNRIVGAVILASLAALFLPMLFDGAGIERREVPRMPPDEGLEAQEVEPLDTGSEAWAFLEEVERRRDDETGGGVVGRPRHEGVDATEVEAASETVAPSLGPDGLPGAWSVQLATFADADNAERMRDRLLGDGYEAYVSDSGAVEGPRHRVLVGPRLDLGAVRRLRDELAERYEVTDGLVVRFTIARSGAEDG